MPTFSAEYLGRLAGGTGFRPDTLEKVLRLSRVLDQVGRHPFLGERLALKGGTALNLFFGAQAPRLSVDLDFNYVRPVERDEMLREKGEVERALGLIAEGDGYRLQGDLREHAGGKMYLSYRNGLGTPDRIEVDVNFLYRVSLQRVVIQEGWTPDPDFPYRARLVGLEETLAGKLLALVDRGAPRDLYDTAGLAGGRWPYEVPLLRRLFVVLSAGLDRPVLTYEMPHRASLSQTELEEALVPMLRGDELPRRDALTEALAPVMSTLAALSDPEKEYVERIQWGEFKPELVVGDDPEMLERVRRHPMLLWKAENGRKRRRPGPEGGGWTVIARPRGR
ncbi:MAG TPA: nucleotidyl transferase AbiEii/AbiGii toxin family protein [Methylomirabilota bacterium]